MNPFNFFRRPKKLALADTALKPDSKPNRKVLTAQIVHDTMSGFIKYMPNPEKVAEGTRDSYDTYREMRTDPRVSSLLDMLKTQALNFDINISRQQDTPEEALDFINSQEVFSKGKLKHYARRILEGLDYGFSVTEAVWKDDGAGGFLLDNLITRKPERFCYDNNWSCYLLQDGERRPLIDPYKWLEYQHNPQDENPYGTSVLRCVYWPWRFKQAGYDFWVEAVEKFAVKSIVALFESNGSPEAVAERAGEIAALLEGIESGVGMGLGNVKELKEIGTSGGDFDFKAFADACDIQISYGLTGQSVTTNAPDGGSYALGAVSAAFVRGAAKGIALEVQRVLQRAVKWAVELQFGKDVEPPLLEFDINEKADFDKVAKAADMGLPLSKSALYNKYNLPQPLNEEDVFLKPAPAPVLSLSDPPDTKKKARIPITVH